MKEKLTTLAIAAVLLTGCASGNLPRESRFESVCRDNLQRCSSYSAEQYVRATEGNAESSARPSKAR